VYVDILREIVEIGFVPGDFAKLESDHTARKLYSNSGFDVYFVKMVD
jgi:hypothetical protein